MSITTTIVTSLLLIHETLSTPVQCYDRNECLGDTISTIEDVYCYGFDACEGTTITTTGSISCYGFEGCSQADYLYGESVRCSGYQSCIMAQEIVSPDEISCGGPNSCMRAESLQAKKVQCEGEASCYEAGTIIAHEYVKSDGEFAMMNVSTVIAPYLRCFGAMSCREIDTISASTITVAGVGALHNSCVDSAGLTSMDFTSVGYYSAYGASIYCRSGTTQCTITCEGSGCYDLYVYYEVSAAQLTIDPQACKKPNNRGQQIADKTWATWCPYIVSSAEMTRDEFEEMKEERMRTMAHKDPLGKEVFDMMQNTMAEQQRLANQARRDMEEREYDAEYALVGERLSYVTWSPDNVWIIAGVLGLFMLFACYYAYRKDKEYDVL